MANEIGREVRSSALRQARARWRWTHRVVFAVVVVAAGLRPARAQQTFRPDRMDTVLYGAAYYPEYMPYDRWIKTSS